MGATIDSTGPFSWTPQTADAGGQFSITVRAEENGVVANSSEGTFEVYVPIPGTSLWSWSAAATNW